MRTAVLVIGLLLATTSVALGINKPEPVVYYPAAGADAAVPVALWLHGYRAFPSVLEDKEYFQAMADKLHVAIVGIPATTLLDDGTPVWSEEPAADHAYLQEVLAELAKKNKLDMEKVALFGFSQGAMVAGDLCARYPQSYRGGILMSPGGITSPKASAPRPDLNKRQILFITCGAKEHPYNIAMAHAYTNWFQKLGSNVTAKEYPDQDKHTRPADFKERFPEWIGTIFGKSP